MRMIFKVSYYVRSNYENKQGKSPLMIRIFLNGEMLNVGSSGIYIDKKLWNNSTNRVKGRGSESLNLNAQLDNISNSLQMIFKKHEFDEDLTLDKIKSIFWARIRSRLRLWSSMTSIWRTSKHRLVQVKHSLVSQIFGSPKPFCEFPPCQIRQKGSHAG